ncbi:type II toxin-antitoxin system RelE family toxin [Sinomicrobium soli]|uniref:type II toxin-antitoxin system RelE family toxin n=1 Tax=Sinomicrobium sp. N-1-3-6 TaxID=2219864 RepID=UPI000DCDAC8B|nr:type II toxin-antitoxin system RelE/ParE family toxin [Sinomicrobium sp. N-1-3-6]RAV30969.1 plasmid stabilization protein [Sinomicrobium sp. N-1-3-6]
MNVMYHSRFKKDIVKIRDRKLKDLLLGKLHELKDAPGLEQVAGVRKLSGHATAYRIRIGDYRLGFFLEDPETVRLQRFVKRNDIYKLFP